MLTLKELARREEQTKRFLGGHRLCAGCGAPLVVRTVLNSIDAPVLVVAATGCLEVSTTRYPATSWDVPWMHVAFENAAAVASGIEAAQRVLRRKGRHYRDLKIVVFAGDGGTYDIGLQALSGALERGHQFLYVCYDNEAYMNTGNQRSGATPLGAQTGTTPIGPDGAGKLHRRKDLTAIVAAHHVPYVAQASISDWQDLSTKVVRAISVDGPSFINVLSTCTLGWGFPSQQAVKLAQLAVETRYWPLLEIREGRWRLNYRPAQRLDIVRWLEPQKRFAHLFRPENRHWITQIQQQVDREWDRLLQICDSVDA